MTPLAPWTHERIQLLMQLWDEGIPSAEIGRRMGTTKNAIIGKVHRLGLDPRIMAESLPPPRNVFEFTGPSCLWPIGHPGEVDFHFCCARPLPGKPYCAEHHARAYQLHKPPPEREGQIA